MSSDSLQAACELAYAVAREEVENDLPVAPPTSMRSFLYVEDLPRRAITVAQQAIEADSEFRQRVANQSSEASTGRAGHLWLTRPAGWAQEFEELTTGDGFGSTDSAAPDPDPELEKVYNDLLTSPVEVVTAQPPAPDFSFDPGESFSPAKAPIAEASLGDSPLASLRSIGGSDEPRTAQTSSFETSALGIAAAAKSPDDEEDSDDGRDDDRPTADGFSFGDSAAPLGVEDSGSDFEADALENELSSLRGLVDRLANERQAVVTGQGATPAPTSAPPSALAAETDTSSSSIADSGSSPVAPLASSMPAATADAADLRALEVDLESATHELSIAREDLAAARKEREEARRQHSDALKRQVELEKEVAAIRSERMTTETELSESQAGLISLEEKLKRLQSQFDVLERESNVSRSQLEVMTQERNQAREDRIAIKAERDELMSQVVEVEEKSGGVDVGELSSQNKALTTELETTARELARMIAQAESFEEQIKSTTATADGLRGEKVELTSRLSDAELALETTRTQHDALKEDTERLAAEVGSLRAERDGLQSQLSELQASLSEVLDEQVETRHRNDTDRKTLNELRVERDVLVAKLNDLELSDREYETRIGALVRERDDLVAARDDLMNERGQLRGEAAASSAEKDQLLEKLRVVEGRIAPMETELQAERRQREELGSRLVELDTIAERNAAELTRLTEERETLSARLDELQAERVEAAEIRVERQNLESQLEEANRRLEDEAERNRKRVAELTEQIGGAETSQASAERQLAELRGELTSLRSEYDGQSRELARLRVLDESAGDTSSALQSELEATKAELAAARSELAAKNAEAQGLTAAVPLVAPTPIAAVDPTTTVVAAVPTDLTTPSPVDEDSTVQVSPNEAGDFDWPPPPQDAPQEPAVAGASLDATQAAEDVDLLAEAGMGTSSAVAEEDDLDEVSALISQTVSGFTAGQPIVSLDDADPSVADGLERVPDITTAVPTLGDDTVTASAGGPPSLIDTGAGPELFDGAPAAGGHEAATDANSGARDTLPGRKRRKIEIPGDILEDEVAVAQFVVSSPDVVLLVDGDSVAKLGWPSLPVAQQRDALVTYLADLSASSGAAPDVVFDGRIGDDQSLPASRAVRIRLSTPPTEPAAALDELVDAYPEQWPIALVTDDESLGSSAGERGAVVLNNGQLLDLFIAE